MLMNVDERGRMGPKMRPRLYCGSRAGRSDGIRTAANAFCSVVGSSTLHYVQTCPVALIFGFASEEIYGDP